MECGGHEKRKDMNQLYAFSSSSPLLFSAAAAVQTALTVPRPEIRNNLWRLINFKWNALFLLQIAVLWYLTNDRDLSGTFLYLKLRGGEELQRAAAQVTTASQPSPYLTRQYGDNDRIRISAEGICISLVMWHIQGKFCRDNMAPGIATRRFFNWESIMLESPSSFY